MSQIRIRDLEGIGVPLINIRLGINGQTVDEAYDDKFTDYSGNTAWPNPLSSNRGYDLFINYHNILDDHEQKTVHVDSLSGDIDIEVKEIPKVLGRVYISGWDYYAKVGDKDFFFAGESAFLDYFRFLRGEDIRPLLQQSKNLGSNGRRNFFMTYNTGIAGGIGPCNPDEFGNIFYDKLPEFLDLYKEYELYLYSSIFPDNGLFPSWAGNINKQVTHWNRLGEIAKQHDNWFGIELTNEFDAKLYNQVNRASFNRISGVISCAGSYGEGMDPMSGPVWDMFDFHQQRSYPKSVVDGCLANYPPRIDHNIATMLGEPVGFGDKKLNPNREDNPRIAKEIAGTAMGCALGVVFHSQHGGFSQLYDDVEMKCAEAWFGVLKGVI